MNPFRHAAAAVGRSLVRAGVRMIEGRQQSPMQQMFDARTSLLHGGTASRIPVNERTALKFSAVYASVRIIAETKASLPVKVYERLPGNRRAEVHSHPVAELLHTVEPNPDMTPMVFFETRQAHLLTWGNSYAEIVLRGDGTPQALVPLHPSRVRPFRDPRTGLLLYEIDEGDGGKRVLDRSRVLHVPGLGGDGLVGWSPIRLAAESIGIGLANERFAATFFANAARPSMIVEYPGKLSDDAYARLKRDVELDYSGAQSHKPMLMENGVKPHIITVPLNEAQFLESRKFQGEEIAARWYRLPPHVCGFLDRATFSNIEAQDLYFEKHTMRPWLERDEQELNRKLFTRDERRRFYVKHNVDALLRTDLKTRYDAHKTAILTGFKSVNDVRATEDLDPIGPQGDIYILPVNMQPASAFGEKDAGTGGRGDAGSRAVDARLLALAEQTVRGLIQREITHVERSAKHPAEFPERVAEFYVKHRALMEEKLAPLVAGEAAAAWILDFCTQHRLSLGDVLEGPAEELPGRVAARMAQWPDDAAALARRLLSA